MATNATSLIVSIIAMAGISMLLVRGGSAEIIKQFFKYLVDAITAMLGTNVG